MHRQLNMSEYYIFNVADINKTEKLDPYLRGEYETALEEHRREERRLRRMVRKYNYLFGEYYVVI